MKDNQQSLYGNCSAFCGLIAPFFLNIVFLYGASILLNSHEKIKFIVSNSFIFLTILFVMFLFLYRGKVKDFIYFDNFEKTKERKNALILLLTFILQYITIVAFSLY